MKKTKIAHAVSFACFMIGMEYEAKQGRILAS